MNEMVLKSVCKGFAGKMVYGIGNLLLFAYLYWWSGLRIAALEGMETSRGLFDRGEKLFGLNAIHWFALIAFLIFLKSFIYQFYLAKTVTVIDFEKGLITENLFTMPYGKKKVTRRFDRIVGAEDRQGSILRLLGINAGEVQLSLVNYNNTEAQETSWLIPGIEGVGDIAGKIMTEAKDFPGLRVRMEDDAHVQPS